MNLSFAWRDVVDVEQSDSGWSRESLIEEIPELQWQAPGLAESEQWQAYRRHYQLDFDGLAQVSHFAGMLHTQVYDIAVQLWRQPGARGTALIVHGYYDHTGIYGSLIEFCLRQQLDVVIFDLPGHGLSSGERAAIDSFQQYDEIFSLVLQQVQAHLIAPLYLFGQSTGGAIAINYLLKRQLTQAQSPFQAVTLFAPLVRPKGWRRGRLLHSILSLVLRRVKREFNPNSADARFLKFIAEQDPLQPRHLSVRWVGALRQWIPYIEARPTCEVALNIIQGDADNTVDWCHNLSILSQKFPHRQVLMLPGGQHHLVNESVQNRARIYQQVADWLNLG
ncbi:alpha/beta hydrolase [Bacterioplanoides pacificum]|uniref:Alpha/beta hydrolase n=1 Tax=Bacterioplanoides pacificum TaxID=1171596 RepID=A0ABV7VWI0_9GAMM